MNTEERHFDTFAWANIQCPFETIRTLNTRTKVVDCQLKTENCGLKKWDLESY